MTYVQSRIDFIDDEAHLGKFVAKVKENSCESDLKNRIQKVVKPLVC